MIKDLFFPERTKLPEDVEASRKWFKHLDIEHLIFFVAFGLMYWATDFWPDYYYPILWGSLVVFAIVLAYSIRGLVTIDKEAQAADAFDQYRWFMERISSTIILSGILILLCLYLIFFDTP